MSSSKQTAIFGTALGFLSMVAFMFTAGVVSQQLAVDQPLTGEVLLKILPFVVMSTASTVLTAVLLLQIVKRWDSVPLWVSLVQLTPVLLTVVGAMLMGLGFVQIFLKGTM